MRLLPGFSRLGCWLGAGLVCSWGALLTPGLTQPLPSTAPGESISAPTLGADDEITLTLETFNFGSYGDLMHQAHQDTAGAIATAFANQPNLQRVSVYVMGVHNGTIVPLLRTQVSRADWHSRPDVNHWGQPLGFSARLLLGFDTFGSTSTPIASRTEGTARSNQPVSRGRSSRLRRRLLGESANESP